ncbi:MAG TPA: hypothetical protein VGD98_16215 [Ktedonobacteraceae bacterium]
MFGEFNQRPDEEVRNANWQGWTPPWMEREGQGAGGPQQGWRGSWGHGPGHHHGRRGPRGPFFGGGRAWGPWNIPEELLALRVQAAEVARLFAIASRGAFNDKERLARLRAFLDRSHKELAEIIYGSSQEQASEGGTQASGSPETGEA